MKKIILFFVTYFIIVLPVDALKLVSVGDSILSGYLLQDENDSFDNLLAEELNFDFYEYSYIGMTSDMLLDDLDNDNLKENIKAADIIILSIGSNDLLDLMFEMDFSNINIDFYNNAKMTVNNTEGLATSINSLNNLITDELKNKVDLIIDNFEINYELIINKIRKLNNKATIYINNFYNPYFNLNIPIKGVDLSNISSYFDDVIDRFNSKIKAYDNVKIINIHSLLRKNKYLNVNYFSLNFDPHPNKKGQKEIFKEYLKQMTYKVQYEDNTYYVLKGGNLKLEEPTKKGYKFVKWNHDLNNINSDMEIKPIFKKNIVLYIYISVGIVTIFIISLIVYKIKKA